MLAGGECLRVSPRPTVGTAGPAAPVGAHFYKGQEPGADCAPERVHTQHALGSSQEQTGRLTRAAHAHPCQNLLQLVGTCVSLI